MKLKLFRILQLNTFFVFCLTTKRASRSLFQSSGDQKVFFVKFLKFSLAQYEMNTQEQILLFHVLELEREIHSYILKKERNSTII